MLDAFYVFLFISELAIWIGIGRLAYLHTKGSKGFTILFGVLTTVPVIVFRVFFLASKADYRLLKLPRAILSALMFLAAGFALCKKEDRIFGMLLMSFSTVKQIIGRYVVSIDEVYQSVFSYNLRQ